MGFVLYIGFITSFRKTCQFPQDQFPQDLHYPRNLSFLSHPALDCFCMELNWCVSKHPVRLGAMCIVSYDHNSHNIQIALESGQEARNILTAHTFKSLYTLLSGHWWSCSVVWSEVVAVGQNLRSISSQGGLQLLNVLVTLTLSHRSFNYDTDQTKVWITLGHWHCGLETFMLGPGSEPMQSSITARSTGQSANHLHHRGDD